MQSSPTIFIKDAALAYQGQVLFDQLDLTLSANKITCLLGPSGVGKTTLLRLIANLIAPSDKVAVRATITLDPALPLTEHVSYMAQTDLLLPWLNVLDNALLGDALRKTISSEKLDRAKKLLTQVGLQQVLQKFPDELSGGMRQRVALVRTLLEEKPIVLMDEPFSAVDAITRFELQNLAATILKNRTVLLITHDLMESLRIADEIIVLTGMPATIKTKITLHTPTPRNFSDPEVLTYQEELFEALMKGHAS